MKIKALFLSCSLGIALHLIALLLLDRLPIRCMGVKISSLAFHNETSPPLDTFFDKQLPTEAPQLSLSLKEELPSLACAPIDIALPQTAAPLSPSLLSPIALLSDLTATAPLLARGASPLTPLPSGGGTLPHIDFAMEGGSHEAIAESDLFNVNVEFFPRSSRPGYIFKATFLPKEEAPFKRIRTNYFFLLDRSNSILRGRYFYNKKAVSAALSYMQEGDTFNILIFDHRVVRLGREPLVFCKENIERAQHFLEETGHGGYFAATDIYTSLGKIIPSNVKDEEINIAILLSDGDTYLSLERQRCLIGQWSESNAGKVSLFCLASGTGNNLGLLDILSRFNKGELVYVPKHEQVVEKLPELVHTLHHPIGKEITATALSGTDALTIYLQPQRERLPDLYKNHPYIVYGWISQLSDFTLFLQGKYYDRTFDIYKKISFSTAKNASPALEREWASLASHDFYDQFFRDGKLSHLHAASELLTPLNIPLPFSL